MGNWLYIADRMKKNIKAPVSMAYRLFVPEIPEKAMAEGKLDMWEMCRPMIADPLLPKKIMEDRQQDIIRCIACNVCLARLFRDTEICCTVRPSLGHENDVEWGFYGFQKSKTKKKIIVVGSGIAGLQAAAIAAEKGHEVTVYEKNDHVGGQFSAAAYGPWGDKEFQRMVDYLKAQCDKQGARWWVEYLCVRADNSLKFSDPSGLVVCPPDSFVVDDPRSPGAVQCVPRNPDGPPGHTCVTGNCVVGMPDPPHDKRSAEQCEVDQCEFACGAAWPGPVTFFSRKEFLEWLAGQVTASIGCDWICKDPKRRRIFMGQGG